MEAILRVQCPMCDGEGATADYVAVMPRTIEWRRMECSVCDGRKVIDVPIPLQIPDEAVRTSAAVYLVSMREGAA